MFPAPMRAMCAQVWLVPTSVRALHTLERGTAAYWGGGEAQEAACGGGKVVIPAILTRLPGPGHAVRSQDCEVSTFGRALHHLESQRLLPSSPARGIAPSSPSARFPSAFAIARCVVVRWLRCTKISRLAHGNVSSGSILGHQVYTQEHQHRPRGLCQASDS